MDTVQSSRAPAEDHPADDAEGSGSDYLADAAAFLRASIADDAAELGTLHALGSRQAEEVAVLQDWIEDRSLWVQQEAVKELWLGGSEHDVERIGNPVNEVRRVTKPSDEGALSGYGFMPVAKPTLCLMPSSLSAYLCRLALLASVFPEVACRLEGFIRTPVRLEVVTRQRYIPGRLLSDIAADLGKKEMQSQVDHWFRQRGFAKLYLSQQVGPSHAWYRAEDNLALFDAKPANLIAWDGHMFPIDVIPVQPIGALWKAIQSAME